MKHSYLLMFAVLATLGLSACDRGDSESNSESAAPAPAMPENLQKDEAIGAIDNAVEAMDEMADEAMDDASDSLDEATEALDDMMSK
ncbi:MAG: hypothetical protein ACPH4D_01665 [Porticoccaceae bacterium]|jgi:hypothetical protein